MAFVIMNMAGTVNHNRKNQNVFIASLPRSGSTLLGMILNQHLECFNIGESFYWGRLNPENEICTCGLKCCPVLLYVYSKARKDNYILQITETVSEIDSTLQRSNEILRRQIETSYFHKIIRCCSGFDRLADIFRKITKKRIIIDTSSNIIMAKSLVIERGWKVIVLTRDPRGVIFSLKKAAVRYGEDVPTDLWRGYLLDFYKRAGFISPLKNVIFVRYEDLCGDALYTVKKVCDFLEIDFDPGMLKYRHDKGHLLMANRVRFGNSEEIREDNGWLLGLSTREKEALCRDRELSFAIKKYGYNFKDNNR